MRSVAGGPRDALAAVDDGGGEAVAGADEEAPAAVALAEDGQAVAQRERPPAT